MEKLEFKITNIKVITEDEMEISINVWDKEEVTTILDNLSNENELGKKSIKIANYSFTISPLTYAMSHCKECELEECFSIYNQYEYFENLNPRLRRQWKTANIVDNLTAYFFKIDFFNHKIFTNLSIEAIE